MQLYTIFLSGVMAYFLSEHCGLVTLTFDLKTYSRVTDVSLLGLLDLLFLELWTTRDRHRWPHDYIQSRQPSVRYRRCAEIPSRPCQWIVVVSRWVAAVLVAFHSCRRSAASRHLRRSTSFSRPSWKSPSCRRRQLPVATASFRRYCNLYTHHQSYVTTDQLTDLCV